MPGQPGSGIAWPLFFGGVTILSIIFGGSWVLFQSMRASDREFVIAAVSHLRTEVDRTRQDILDLRTVNVLMDKEIKADIAKIKSELTERYQLFLTQKEYVLHEKSSDDRWRTQAVINQQAIDAYLSYKAWEAWRQERDKYVIDLRDRIKALEVRK